MKKILALVLAVCLVLALSAAAFADDALAPKDGGSKLIFTTGGEAGTYYGFGSVIAQKVSEVTSTNVTAIVSGGSKANIDALDMGDAQLGFSQSDVLAYAYAGTRTFEEYGEPVTSCCVLAGQAEGADIITLEGVNIDGKPDVVQQAFIDAGAIQCGFCIPGMILTAEALLMHNPNPTMDEVKLAMSGNLCRCTGYAKINEAVLLAAERKRGEEAK